MLPDLGPIPIKERNSILFVERCHVDVRDGAFVMIDKEGVRTQNVPSSRPGSCAGIGTTPWMPGFHNGNEVR